MASENPLLSADPPAAPAKLSRRAPIASQPAPEEPAGNALLSVDTAKPMEPTVGVAEDMARAALAKGVRGAASLPGLLGDVPALFGKQSVFPTTENYIDKLKGLSPGVKDSLSYEPQTTAGRYTGSVAEFLPGAMIPGGGVTRAMRLVGGIGAGLGAQGAEDMLRTGDLVADGSWQQGLGKAAGAIAGGLGAQGLARGAANLLRSPETLAANQLAAAQASDLATGTAKAAPGYVVDADLAPAVAGGVKVNRLLKNAASKADDEAIGGYNASVAKMASEAPAKVGTVVDDLFGRPVQMFDERDLMNQRIKQVNDANYTKVMALPEAQAIPQDQLRAVAQRMPSGTFNKMLEQFRIDGVDPASLGLVKTPQGNWGIPPSGASLRFWDEAKQTLDNQIGSYMDPITRAPKPGSADDIRRLTGLKSDLVKVLDKAVDPYKQIRFEASELYGARNAMEAGYKYFSDQNFKKLHEVHKLVNDRLTPDQKNDFAYGFAAAYKDALAKNPSQALGVFDGKKANFNTDKLRFALGEKDATRLLGSVHSEFLNNSVKALQPGMGGNGALKWGATGLAGGALAEAAAAGSNILQALTFSLSPTAIASGIVLGTAKAAYTAREKKIAEQVLRLAADPSQNARLGKLIAQNKDARSFLAKFYGQAARVAPAAASEVEAPELTITPNRPQRRSGGRVASHEVHADRLIAAAERAKRQIGKKTESILEKPDEIVVKALQIANQNLEG